MIRNIKTNKDRGFTIVELLVVIVVIGILATITIVSYTGVSAKANTAQAQSAGATTLHKLNAYYVDTNSYPANSGQLKSDSTKVYYINGITFDPNQISVQPATPNTVNILTCGTDGNAGAPANFAGITIVSGMEVAYWDYSGTPGIKFYSFGTAGTSSSNYRGTITGVTYGGWPVACYEMPAS